MRPLGDNANGLAPEIERRQRIARGEFGLLFGWLAEKIYRRSRKFTPAGLVERATGQPLQIDPYICCLRDKHGQLYVL